MAQYTDSPKSSSTGTFSATFSALDSNIIPSSVVAPGPAHQSTTDNNQGATAPSVSGEGVNRWSEGTFGHSASAAAAASSVGSAPTQGAGTSSYSGKTEEATTAQAVATAGKANTVTIGKSGSGPADGANTTNTSNPRENATSADAAGIFQGLSEDTLEQLEKSSDSAKRRRQKKHT